MRVKVLGSAAGGGFPQWNCACRNCRRLRAGSLRGSARSQTQVAVSSGDHSWALLNASPDLRTQILATPQLAPANSLRDTPIAAVVLTSADVDSVAGLLHLREFQPLQIYATRSVRRIVEEENRIFRVLNRAKPPAVWHDISLDNGFPLMGSNSSAGESTVRCLAMSLGGSYPDYVSESLRRSLPAEEAVVGLALAQGEKTMFFAPSLPGRTDAWKAPAHSSHFCMLDGTFWTEQELISAGAGSKTAREIGHVSLSGPSGLIEQFGPVGSGKRVLIHINNTNPILDEESPEHILVRRAGWEIAYDGMEFEL